ncbi:Indole-3-glycerol phosphate synthase (plasmid) [Streptomyces sp. ADI95-16]|uniref:indole-3-glycerol-phosphate synthase n=1 Tax=unclassified Streptomyces TaxID=2593676 RepID=UPI000F3A9435|nr:MULTISPECIES: indole-3-glycerol-phosphate synthase [unclassified Streptomyces]AYV33076.1 Indole-3-glycerol phosphate synthase [Streptomyces sp. ADI95-16]RPK24629.1 Indole-3-glycerol phosphate synthase [Streptomyces sp. ADI91-18]
MAGTLRNEGRPPAQPGTAPGVALVRPPARSFTETLTTARREGRAALIVDVKCRSPRDGELIPDAGLENYVRELLDAGVDALATVTEPVYFGGSLGTARRIRALSGVPLMRKEFFTSVGQIDESHALGFDAVHLTLRTIGDIGLVTEMQARAVALGIEPVIGVHTHEEAEQAVALGARVVGLNNRDIRALELDEGTVSHSESVTALLPPEILVISESGLHTPEDVARAAQAGADAVLIGTAVAKNPHPAAFLRALEGAAWRR